MYNTQTETLKARKSHRCTHCGEEIQLGETYARWTTFDDSAFVSRMHPECLHSLEDSCEYGEFEYTPYSGERPTPTPKD